MESKATCRKTVKHNKGRADGKETLWILSQSTPSIEVILFETCAGVRAELQQWF